MNRNIYKKLLGGAGLATALFVFQACYGTPRDFDPDVLIYGKVISQSTGEPVHGILVTIEDFDIYGYTDSLGEFSIYHNFREGDRFGVLFEDVDSVENGRYQPFDTLVKVENGVVHLPVALKTEE